MQLDKTWSKFPTVEVDTWSANDNASTVLLTHVAQIEIVFNSKPEIFYVKVVVKKKKNVVTNWQMRTGYY